MWSAITPDEREKAMRLRREGLTAKEIAAQIRRSVRAVSRIVNQAGAAPQPPRPGSFAHHPAVVDEIKRLIMQGLSASAVGKRVGLTRNAVLGLKFRHFPELVVPKAKAMSRAEYGSRASPPRKPKAPRMTVIRPEFERAPLPKDETWRALPGAEPVSLLDLEEHHCRWPIGQQHVVGFCGCRKVPGLSYCDKHAATATAAPAKEKARGVASGRVSAGQQESESQGAGQP